VRRALAFVASLSATFAAGQEPAALTPKPAIAPPANVTIHYAGPGVTAPELYPAGVSISLPRHCVQIDGVVKLSAVVDENGIPRSIQTLHSDDARLGNFALEFVAAQRFKPGTYNGAQAAVAIAVTAALHTCAPPMKRKIAQDNATLTLSSHPFLGIDILTPPAGSPETTNPVPAASISSSVATDQGGGRISAPTPILQPNPQYSKAAREKKIAGTCLIGATIDAYGVPQNVHVVESLEPSLDHNSIEAIETWRFNPALQDRSVPVSFEVTIAVTFWLQEKMFLSFATIVPKPSSTVVSSVAPSSAKNISPPIPLNANEVQFEYSPYGQLAQITGLCVVAFIVDKDGMPQNARVVKSLESSMDENAVTAVNELRFKPAFKDGITPVPSEVIMPINFRLRARISRQDLFEDALSTAIFIFFR
jgi:TonB family protein